MWDTCGKEFGGQCKEACQNVALFAKEVKTIILFNKNYSDHCECVFEKILYPIHVLVKVFVPFPSLTRPGTWHNI